jgi:2-iminobutanoate/2-iminopropanoate deaminase
MKYLFHHITKIGWLIAINFAILVVHKKRNFHMSKSIINTPNAPAPIGPYNQAVKAGNLLFISGQIAINPANGNVEATDVIGEAHQVMQNLKAILHEAGMDFHQVVKTTIFLSDMSLFSAVNEIYAKYLSGDFPARETVAVKGLPKNVHVEISMIAVM